MNSQLRLNLVALAFFLLGAAVAGRLFFLQILRGDFYRALAQGQGNILEQEPSLRGDIFLQDKTGKLYSLATNRTIKFAFISPVEIEDADKTAGELVGILQLDKKDLLSKMSKKDSFYELLESRITEEEAQSLSDVNLKGVYVGERLVRYFPQGKLAAHLVGFVGAEGEGQYGAEGYYDRILRGTNPKTGRGETGKNILLDLFEALKDPSLAVGENIILSVDYNVQFFAEGLLEEASKNLNIEEGSIIVMDPKTGKILAMANFPSFDPNNYFLEKDWDIFQNSSIQKLFEPGSAFKPLTMSSALQEHKVSPETKYTDEGQVRIGGYVVYNYDGRIWGERTMTEVLEKSINTGAVFAERQLGHNLFLSYMEKFGFFKPTGIDLQGEIFSENKSFKKGYEINFTTASFGQGIEMTPIQLLRAFAAIVNGGNMVKPFAAERIVNADTITEEVQPEIGPQVISAETSAKIVSMLMSVVENGFGKAARIPGYYIGGKTGTAQVSFSALGIQKSGYSEKTIQSFVGFAPALDPRFIILIKLNNPKTKTAEYSAVPIFHDLAKYIIDYLEIPPDHE